MATALAFQAETPLSSEVSTTLPVAAAVAYEIFADAGEIPRWLPLIQSARILSRRVDGRANRVAFTRTLDRGSLAYTLEYTYEPKTYTIAWATSKTSNVVLNGDARFVPLSAKACLMLYRLVIELPIVDDLIAEELDGHPASFVVSGFREHLRRLC